eukprot:GGOE01010679.1.p1 GENE.GGOE01010679.1~~GGOE01010679.1.p1  ORF type:complete len:806 (-),score=125.63 GGOE01010679.1:381-2798(-)
MLDDGPLLAPYCYHLPPSIDPVEVFQWFHRIDHHLVCEIFTLSSKSILYEAAQYYLRRPWGRPAATDRAGLAAMMRYLMDSLRWFEHSTLLVECHMLFMNHLEAGLRCIRFQPVLERLLPADRTQPILSDPEAHHATCGAEGPTDQCAAEEVDMEKWVFRDVDAQGRLGHPNRSNTSNRDSSGRTGPRLLLGADAKLAYSVTLFIWATEHLLARRIGLLQEFPADHSLFLPVPQEALTVRSLGNRFETLLLQRRECSRNGLVLYCQKNWPRALEEFSKALNISVDGDDCNYFLLRYRGSSHFHLHQYRQAVEDYSAALGCNPHAYAARHDRAEAYEALGELDAAWQDAMQLVHLYPGCSQGQELYTRLETALPSTHPDKLKKDLPSTNREGDSSPGFTPSVTLSATESLQATPEGTSPNSPPSPLTAVSSPMGTPIPWSDHLSINLAALPVYPEPPTIGDPPYVSAILNNGGELEYTICGGKELGRGATGRVYKAVHSSGGWFMAIKEVEAKHLEGAQDLLGALDLMATMKHNNVVRCLGLRRLPGFYHIILEYCSGGSLRSLVNEVQGLSPSLMRKYATEVLRGLRYIHGHGLLHRDIKGGNILLRDDGMAKIADLGTCMRIPEAEDARCDSVKGTVLWMAPETFRGRYSIASDVWSFGCLLIEMATAKDPWHEHQFQEQLTAMVFIATRPDALPAIPPQLGDNDLGRHFFHCCVSRDPSERRSTDLLLRHPWLSSTEPSTPASPYLASPYAGSIQDCFRDKLAATRCRSGFQWTTSSSVTESSLIDTMSSSVPLVESLTKAVQ